MEGTTENRDNSQLPVQATERPMDASVVFGRNSHFAFIYKKTEKLATAVYLITNFIKDSEPLKWKIREGALSLMELNLDWSVVSLAERKELLAEYKSTAFEIVSLSNVAHVAGLISEMNFRILAREFNALVSVIEKGETEKANEDTVMLDPGFFEVATPAPIAPKGNMTFVSRTAVAPQASSVPQTVSVAPVPEAAAPRPVRKQEAPSKTPESKDSRQAIIIRLLSKKSGLNVKDFAESIKGVSEKTIQRELLAMVASGVLKKEGERRWSTYSLAS